MRQLAAALVLTFVACAHDTSESVGSSSARLDVPNSIPTPFDQAAKIAIWDGTAVDLMAADAWASCAFGNLDSGPTTSTIVDARREDAYLSYLAGKMTSAMCSSHPTTSNTLRDWYEMRTNAQCNSEPGTGLPAAATLPAYTFPGIRRDGSVTVSDATADADDIIRYAGVNLCMAHQLRTIAPGASGADAVLLPADQQRDLLEITRERAQTAVLQYALLARIFTAPNGTTTPTTALQQVQTWGTCTTCTPSASQDALRDMAQSFLDAIQLDVLATSDITQLIVRSGSARLARGGIPNTSLPAEIWGPGSWRLRALAELYGGDPFVVGFNTQDPLNRAFTPAPWAHPMPLPQYLNFTDPAFVDVVTLEPQVTELLNLARRYDALSLKKNPTTTNDPAHAFNRNCPINYGVDAQASASRLYRAAEAGLETTECKQQISGVCQPVPPEAIPDPSLGFANDLLWTRRHITPDHAATLVAYLAEVMGRICLDDAKNPYEVAGNENVMGGPLSVLTIAMGPDAGSYYHFAKSSVFEPLPVEQRQGQFSDQAGVPLPNPVYTDALVDGQGLDDDLATQDQHRTFGATSALAFAREAIDLSNDDINANINASWAPSATAYLLERVKMINLIDGAVGTTSGTLSMKTQEVSSMATPVTSGSDQVWHLAIRAPSDDNFWQKGAPITVYNAAVTTSAIVRAFRDYVSQMVLHPETSAIDGTTITSVIGFVSSAHQCAPSDIADETDTAVPVHRFACDIGVEISPLGHTVFAVRTDGPSPQYRLIAGPASLTSNVVGQTLTSHEFTSGGVLNDRGTRVVQRLPYDHTTPFYDGFDLPTRLVPSSDPLLAGAGSGSTALQKYLQNAQDSAQSAVAAVTAAFTTLVQEEQSQTAAQVKVAQSASVVQAQLSGLCGSKAAGGNTCDWSTNITKLYDNNVTGAYNKIVAKATGCTCNSTGCATSSTDPHAVLACTVEGVFTPFQISVPVSNVVLNHLTDPVAPDFADYNGGTLQKDFIDEWSSIIELRDQLVEVETAWEAADAAIDNAENALSAKQQEQQFNCSPGTFALSLVEGVSASAGVTPSVSFSPGPLIEQIKKCADESAQLLAVVDQPLQAISQAADTMASETLRCADAAQTLRTAYADTQIGLHQAQLASQQAQTDAELATISDQSHQVLFRQIHSADLFQAKALLESARRYAVIARRAIEARYVVDLSTMTADEPLVAAPTSWADDVYKYDLSAPAAVGLTIGTAQDTGSTYPNAIQDYVDNLNRFVNGFVIARPSTAVANDTQILSLPGPTGLVTGTNSLQGAVDGMAYKWQFECPDGTWTDIPSNGNPDTACKTGSATLARLTFNLDPWGRVDDGIFDDPFLARYNTRWNRMAINLVGTAVLDCTKANDPLSCYAQSYVPYSFTHVGPAWVTDFNEAWRLLGVPSAQIEAGKALAAEQWLDPISNGWSQPYVTAIARTELVDRPFGGAYKFDLQLSPQVVLSRIERVQILLDYAYWVKEH